MPLNASTHMRTVVATIWLTLVFIAAPSGTNAQEPILPRFESYRVAKTFSGRPADVNLLSHPKARLFRTMLKLSAEKGPNFAGHYTIGTWGCGSDCRMLAVIDARSGRVYFAPFWVGIDATFRLDSALLIVNESETQRYLEGEEMLDVYMPAWYVWRGNRFVQIFKSQAERIRRKNRRQ
jgi:hypothetical protein